MSLPRVFKEHKNAYWVIAAIGFFAAVGLIFFENEKFYRDFLEYFGPLSASPAAEMTGARLTIDFGNGTKRAFQGQPQAGMTILSAIRLSAEAGKFDASTDERGYIIAIGGFRNAMSKRWKIYRNNTAVEDIPGHVELEAGDRIELRYE